MPTSYTQFIVDGDITNPKDFLHLCLRNFGLLYSLSDNPLSVESDYTNAINETFDSDLNYYRKKLIDAGKEFAEFKSKTNDELREEYNKSRQEKINEIKKLITERDEINSKYTSFINTIKNWNCSHELENIKQFSIRQLEVSIEKLDWETDLNILLTTDNFDEYVHNKLNSLEYNINYYKNELDRTLKRKEDAISFYNKFKEEIKTL